MADVLVVEDDADLAVTVSELLASDGHSTRVASNGQEGLEALDERLPDLIVLDIEMPVLDGRGMTLVALALDAGRERIPIVLTSGHPGLRDVAGALGTDYWIAKPCSLLALRTLVARALVERHPPRCAGDPDRSSRETHR